MEVAGLIACCDGTRSLSDALEVVDRGSEPPPRSEVLAIVRTLIANSFLVPAPSGEDEAGGNGRSTARQVFSAQVTSWTPVCPVYWMSSFAKVRLRLSVGRSRGSDGPGKPALGWLPPELNE